MSFFTHQGNVPSPDCLRTFGLLRAVGSGTTLQTGAPVPVTPEIQPSGKAPGGTASKFTLPFALFAAGSGGGGGAGFLQPILVVRTPAMRITALGTRMPGYRIGLL